MTNEEIIRSYQDQIAELKDDKGQLLKCLKLLDQTLNMSLLAVKATLGILSDKPED